jgi:hypothetical protein
MAFATLPARGRFYGRLRPRRAGPPGRPSSHGLALLITGKTGARGCRLDEGRGFPGSISAGPCPPSLRPPALALDWQKGATHGRRTVPLDRAANAASRGGGHLVHVFRHTFGHLWRARMVGDWGDLMILGRWSSREMPDRYGRSAAVERAKAAHQRFSPGIASENRPTDRKLYLVRAGICLGRYRQVPARGIYWNSLRGWIAGPLFSRLPVGIAVAIHRPDFSEARSHRIHRWGAAVYCSKVARPPFLPVREARVVINVWNAGRSGVRKAGRRASHGARPAGRPTLGRPRLADKRPRTPARRRQRGSLEAGVRSPAARTFRPAKR